MYASPYLLRVVEPAAREDRGGRVAADTQGGATVYAVDGNEGVRVQCELRYRVSGRSVKDVISQCSYFIVSKYIIYYHLVTLNMRLATLNMINNAIPPCT